MPTKVVYTEGYRYQLEMNYHDEIEIRPPETINTEHIRLDTDGNLLIRNAYAWDGPSGPTIQTKTFMRGSLVHDALYQLMREGTLSESQWRETADNILYRICREDGMVWFRAWYVRLAVRWFGGPSGDPVNDKPVLEAP